ncbi:MAG: transporter substrate-binding domain-containing protein [Pseudomonas sp.]|nr:transporter substrate-binding domain-containing protein [Pseudomonas sp.]
MAFRFICALLLALCTPTAFGDDQTPEAEKLLFMTADVWPWGYLEDNGAPAGLLSVLAERLAQEADLQLDNRVLPHQRLLSKFKHGEADYTVLFENPYLDEFADSLGVVLSSDILLVTDKDYSGKLTLAALQGKRVGYISGTYYGEAFEQNDSLTKIPVYNLDQAIEMLQLDRLDALISSDIVFHHSLKARELQPDVFRYAVHTRGHAAHLYISRQATNRQLAPRIQAALAQLDKSGELRRLFHSEVRSSTH